MAKLEVEIIGDSRSLEKAFDRSAKSAKGFNSDLSKTGKKTGSLFGGLTKGIGLATGALGVAGFAGAAKAAFDEMASAQKVNAQTQAALRSTGSVANVTAKHVDELGNAMLRKSGIDDEATRSAENMLLTFTGVRNETGKGNKIFDQATTAVADLATRMNNGAIPSMDQMKTASIQIGKALNDPIKGVGALRRVGVQLSLSQESLVKHLVHTGDTMGAQKIILGELRKEFGGSAKAAGQTLPGKLAILRESLLNLGGSIAEKLSPQIVALVDRMTKWLNNTKNQKAIMDTLTTVVKTAVAALKILKGTFDLLSKAVGGNKHAIELLVAAYAAWKIAGLISNVATLASKFTLLAGNTNAAAGATRGLSGSMLGKAGLVAAAGVAAFELTTLALKVTGLDKKLKSLGGSAYDAAGKLGLVHDPTAQFKGKTNLGPAASSFLRRRAGRLERLGATPAQAAASLALAHPGVARHDINVLAGVYGRAPTIIVNGGVHVHDAKNPRELQDAITKNARGRPVRRRGDP